MPLPPPLDPRQATPADELRRSRERLLLALEAGRMGTWDWEIRSNRIAWSPTLERLHGIEVGSFSGTFEAFLEDIYPDDRERVLARIDEALTARRDYHVEYRIIRPDGTVRWLESRGRLFCDDRGRPAFMTGVCSDVTERKRGEAAMRLLAEESRLVGASLDCETVLRDVADLLVPEIADWCVIDLVSSEGTLEHVITRHADPDRERCAHEALHRHPPDPDAPVGPPAVVRSGEPALMERITEELLEAAAHDEEHLGMLRALGLRSALIVPLRIHGRVLGALTLATAESRRRFDADDLPLVSEIAHRAAQAVDNARVHQDLEGALAARDRVLAVVSHDLREPLNSVTLALRLIEESGCVGQPPVDRAVEAARRGLERGEHLIRDLLDVSRLDSGRFPLDRQRIDPGALVREVLEPFAVEARDAGIDLEVGLATDLPTLEGDRHRLIQVLSNLLRNALEVTPPGGSIRVSASADDGEVSFRVADTGPGIPPEDLPNLFDAFWQGHGSTRGTAGLGLAIARGLVEAHGGRIRAESEPGAGAVFTFTIPVQHDR